MLPPNFSRKIKLEMEEKARLAAKASEANAMDITALPPMPAKKRPSGLRRVLSSLGGANRKENSGRMAWMDKLEKDGARAGIMVDASSKDGAVIAH
jgi:hypothetical protein